MNETLKGMMKKYDIAKLFRRDNLIVLILLGALLVIIALPTKDTATEEEGSANIASEQNMQVDNRTSYEDNSKFTADMSTQEYVEYLETKLQKMLAKMEGVGEVEVMITLKSTEELVVGKDAPLNKTNTSENDSTGGNREISEVQEEEQTIYSTDGSASEPFIIKTLLPEVEGVVVIAQGAEIGENKMSITNMVCALFGIEAHKIQVVKMN